MTMRGLGKAVAIAAAGSAALAGTAQAASLTITPAKPCYLSGERITATAAGFTPGGLVNFASTARRSARWSPTRPATWRPRSGWAA